MYSRIEQALHFGTLDVSTNGHRFTPYSGTPMAEEFKTIEHQNLKALIKAVLYYIAAVAH